MAYNVFVSENNYVEGYDVVELGGEFEDSFLHYNTVPRDAINRFLAAVSNEQDRILKEVVDNAVERVQSIAHQNGWNAVLNFDVQFEGLGEWATINCVCVHVYGYLCNIAPSYI